MLHKVIRKGYFYLYSPEKHRAAFIENRAPMTPEEIAVRLQIPVSEISMACQIKTSPPSVPIITDSEIEVYSTISGG